MKGICRNLGLRFLASNRYVLSASLLTRSDTGACSALRHFFSLNDVTGHDCDLNPGFSKADDGVFIFICSCDFADFLQLYHSR